jgi:hypothetical protein
MILAEQEPSSARVIAAVIFFGSFLDLAKNERWSTEISINIQDGLPRLEENATRTSCG